MSTATRHQSGMKSLDEGEKFMFPSLPAKLENKKTAHGTNTPQSCGESTPVRSISMTKPLAPDTSFLRFQTPKPKRLWHNLKLWHNLIRKSMI
jgi:hypothetical protein